MDKLIYFDNAATCAVRKEVIDTCLPYFDCYYGNPSSIYRFAGKSKTAIDEARQKVKAALGITDGEVYFTSGGTESDNWAIKGIAENYRKLGNHIITCAIEHHAVLHTCSYLEKNGYEVTYLPVDEFGKVNTQSLLAAIKPTTILISIMFANNEIGTIQPIKEIGQIAKEKNIIFHTDAVQAVGQIPINVDELNIDLLSLSGHKLYGPKGIGALYVRKGIRISPMLHGGTQEKNRRAGTENVAGIVGLGRAIELAVSEIPENTLRLTKLRDKLIKEILGNIKNTRLNGHPVDRLPGNVNISFEFIEGESILIMLDMKGVCASSGSACTSGSLDPSHVLLAIGLPHEKAHGSLRLSLGKYNTEEEVNYFIEVLPPIIQRLRDMSPLYSGEK